MISVGVNALPDEQGIETRIVSASPRKLAPRVNALPDEQGIEALGFCGRIPEVFSEEEQIGRRKGQARRADESRAVEWAGLSR